MATENVYLRLQKHIDNMPAAKTLRIPFNWNAPGSLGVSIIAALYQR